MINQGSTQLHIAEQPLHHKSHILVIITCNKDITIDNIGSHVIFFPMLLVPYQALCKLMERHGKNWQHLFLIYLHLHIILNRQHFPTFCTFSSSTCYTLYSIGNTCSLLVVLVPHLLVAHYTQQALQHDSILVKFYSQRATAGNISS